MPDSASRRVGWRGAALLVIASLTISVGAAEVALRIAGFHFDFVPTLEFGWPDPKAIKEAYEPDPDLVWVTKDYRATLREARREHPAIVFMGDSCTEFGTYPSRTVALLTSEHSPDATGVKLGVGGWSTEQGVQQLERDVIPLHPKIVTIYYGWNDHWVAMGLTDPEIARAHRLLAVARVSRIVQLWLRMEVHLAEERVPAPNRVPLPRYEANLRRMSDEARHAGILPLFITAPSNHVAGHEPEYLAKRHLRSLAELVPLHTAYVDATREVARETGTPLCDAAAAFAAMPLAHDHYFMKDGIHLTPDGDQAMAAVLARCIVSLPHH
jgi:lysophospholipase L1-like esterase